MATSFPAFLASKRPSDDLGGELGICADFGEVISGFVYLDHLYIEVAKNRPDLGKYTLNIERSDWFSDTIEDLEARLYTWANDEGY